MSKFPTVSSKFLLIEYLNKLGFFSFARNVVCTNFVQLCTKLNGCWCKCCAFFWLSVHIFSRDWCRIFTSVLGCIALWSNVKINTVNQLGWVHRVKNPSQPQIWSLFNWEWQICLYTWYLSEKKHGKKTLKPKLDVV